MKRATKEDLQAEISELRMNLQRAKDHETVLQRIIKRKELYLSRTVEISNKFQKTTSEYLRIRSELSVSNEELVRELDFHLRQNTMAMTKAED